LYLGIPVHERSAGRRLTSKIPLAWSADEFKRHILSLYPTILSFTLHRCLKNKNLERLPDSVSPSNLRQLLGRSQLYVVPRELNEVSVGASNTEDPIAEISGCPELLPEDDREDFVNAGTPTVQFRTSAVIHRVSFIKHFLQELN